MKSTDKKKVTAAIEKILSDNMKAGMFVGLDKNDIEPEGYGTIMGSTEDVALALCSIAMNSDNQIFAKTFRDALFTAVIQITASDTAISDEFMKTFNKVTNNNE